MEDTKLTDKIRKQVEFYFSDSNYPKDKFLRAQAALNDEGWVALSVVASFSRTKALTTDIEQIKEALRMSETLKMNNDETMIRRVAPIPEEDTSAHRSIYAKGFPIGTEGYTLDDVEKVFKPLGNVLCIRIRKTLDKKLKPSVFVEFATEDEAKAVVAAKPKFHDTELTVMMKSDYFTQKKEERKQRVQEKKAKRKSVSDDGSVEGEEKQEKKKQKTKEKKEPETKPYGANIMTFKNVGDNLTRETLKAIFGEFGTVAFVDFSSGEHEGAIRFENAEVTKKAVETMQSTKKEVGGMVPELAILTEPEEKAYWNKVVSANNKGGPQRRRGGPRRKRY